MAKTDSLNEIRHSLAHLLGAAVLELYPGSKLAIGPAIDDGFYYDIDVSGKISDTDLPRIETEMRKILKTWDKFEEIKETAASAKKHYVGNPYKLGLVGELVEKKENITSYQSGRFVDLCRGGHVASAKSIKSDSFKLSHVAGAYWRGSEKNKQLTRIYGLAFETKEDLDSHLVMVEEAKKRDHRKLGKELGLFTLVEEIGPGLPLFYPKGTILRRLVEDFIGRLQESRGYQPIWIPHITKGELYKISGHLDKFDALYPPMNLEGESNYYLKPMNCPHFMMLYKSLPHSYRELPIRYVSTTTNYRYEKSGELSGLTRVRALTQDDCHVFAAPDQIEEEINLMLDMIDEAYKAFGFKDFWVRVSTHDPKNKKAYLGDPEIWKKSESSLEKLIKTKKWNYKIVEGEAAFYGPKLDFMFKDSIGREWQLSTVQLDMNLPEKFDLEYVDSEGNKKRPIVLHRAILGSTERFLGILIEHYAGAFPLWLSPVQVSVLPISDKQNKWAESVTQELLSAGIRVEINRDNETLGKKIRQAEMQKMPYVLIIGEKEESAKSVAVRQRGKGDLGQIKLEELIKKLKKELEDKN